MADGLCSGDSRGNNVAVLGNSAEKNPVIILKKTYADQEMASCDSGVCVVDVGGETVAKSKSPFFLSSRSSPSDSGFGEMCSSSSSSSSSEGEHKEKKKHRRHDDQFLMDDCRKKRCVDRYDSSESSDSGVAVLSCTDCSGSSTASSDITDPGSPFSTTSTHSDDSTSSSPPQPVVPSKMPPTTQTAHHHPPWPWTAAAVAGETPKKPPKIGPKRLKSVEDAKKSKQSPSSPSCLINHNNNNSSSKRSNGGGNKCQDTASLISSNHNNNNNVVNAFSGSGCKKPEVQGKITEYFKSQIKVNVVRKEGQKALLVDQQTQFNGGKAKKSESNNNNNNNKRKAHHQVTVPRKILPAPSKFADNINLAHHHHHHVNFAPTVTLTTVGFPPNLTTYIHPTPKKPPDGGAAIFVPQFENATAYLNRTAATTLNVIHQQQKMAAAASAINNFNCVKLNATVVPIVKLNALPSLASLVVPPQDIAGKCVVAPPSLSSSSSVSSSPPTPCSVDSGVSSLKECLEVSVDLAASVALEQKSPILSQPKTIRFPPAARRQDKEEGVGSQKESHGGSGSGKSSPAQEVGLCRWAECSLQFDTSGALLEHLQVKHVISQASQEHYVCLWLGCKVHGRTSCSRSWLERHVLAHAGTKPFRCIVDGCGQRFNSQLTLERHVNGHFNGDGSQNGSAKKSTETSAAKLFKRNGKKIRFRRQPWSARMFDFMDNGIMEGLQHRILTLTEDRTLGGQIPTISSGDNVHLQSEILARRVEPDGNAKLLLRWKPEDLMPDEWVNEMEYVSTKKVAIPSLSPAAKTVLHALLFNNGRKRERRRKPVSKQQT